MKKIYIYFILFMCVILAYVTNLTAIPNSIILFKNETLNLGVIYGIFENREKVIQTSLNTEENIIKEETIHLSLFNLIKIKDINVKTIESKKVIPLR